MRALIEVSGATIHTPGGRPLFDGLNPCLSRERVALIGRNGVGKSTLLTILAGDAEVREGRVTLRGKPHFVPQALRGPTPSAMTDGRERALSQGELRRAALTEARSSGAEILLLDEPSEDLDEAGVAWLRSLFPAWPGCLVVATHDRRLLADFRHFFVVSEAGCRYVAGTLALSRPEGR